MPSVRLSHAKQILLLLLLPFLMSFIYYATSVHHALAQETRFIIWVFDKKVQDSQFGYYDGTATHYIDPIYTGADIEGLACLGERIYATGGLDGDAPSTLNTLVIDQANNIATLHKVADIHTVSDTPLFEVVSLSTRHDGTLWGYADLPPLRGLIQLDPASGVAELIVPFDKKIEGIAWIDDTLWLAGGHSIYRWTMGENITTVFHIDGVNQIEALEAIDGLLYAGVHDDDRGVIAIDPNTGAIIEGAGFPAPDDIEGITFCPLQPTPTPTITPAPTESVIPEFTPTPTVPPYTALDPADEPPQLSSRLMMYLPFVAR